MATAQDKKILQELQAAVRTSLKARGFAERQPQGLFAPIEYTLQLGGKRIRPMLCLAAAYAFAPERWHEALPAAAALEIFHNFTLLHDDLMDRSPLRRGQETVYRKWDDNTAILSGDAMCIEAYAALGELEAKVLQPELFGLFSRMALEVCVGQQLDMDFEHRSDVAVAEYLEMIRLKTSVLLGTSLGPSPARGAYRSEGAENGVESAESAESAGNTEDPENTENTENTESSESLEGAERTEAAESLESSESIEQPAGSTSPRGVLQQTDDAELEAQSEPAEEADPTDGSDEAETEQPEGTKDAESAESSEGAEQSEENKDAGQAESAEQPLEPEPVEVPTSLVEPEGSSGEHAVTPAPVCALCLRVTSCAPPTPPPAPAPRPRASPSTSEPPNRADLL